MSKTRIVLADDHPVVLAGLRTFIEGDNEFEVVGEAATGVAALQLIRATNPDVAVLDISMPELNGIALSRKLAEDFPRTRILLLTLHEDRAFVNQAMAAGVRGYVLKRTAAENLPEAIRVVAAGGVYVDAAIIAKNFEEPARKASSGVDPKMLTDRESDVLKATALGFTNKEIARKLDVSVKSVETYKSRAAEKLGLKSRAEIVRYAAAHGWLENLT